MDKLKQLKEDTRALLISRHGLKKQEAEQSARKIIALFQQHKREWLAEIVGENEDPDEFYKKHRHRTDIDWTRTEAALHERNIMRDEIKKRGGVE